MKILKIGDRVLTPGGHKGTVISTLGDTTVEVELDFDGLMHYCSGALINPNDYKITKYMPR